MTGYLTRLGSLILLPDLILNLHKPPAARHQRNDNMCNAFECYAKNGKRRRGSAAPSVSPCHYDIRRVFVD
jgi:hypothetical protein